jgi:hypothetical protein
VAEDDLEHGRAVAAAAHLARLGAEGTPEPVWIAPWTKLLQARLADLRGERVVALGLYNQVFQKPYGSMLLRDLARAGQEHPYHPSEASQATPSTVNHPR